MFSKAEKVATTHRPESKPSGTPSIISANLHVVGNLNSDGEVQIDGTVDGDVSGKSLIVGASATVNGQIEVDEITVRGNVNGRIKARLVQLNKSAKVIGDIWHESLAVEAGAYLEGHCKRLDKGEAMSEPKIDFARNKVKEDDKVVVAKPVVSGGAA